MKLSIGKAWDEASAFLGREARLIAPVALAAFAIPAVLARWAFPNNPQGSAGLLMLLVLVIGLIGQMTIILLAVGWHGSVGQAMRKAVNRLPVLLGALIIVFFPLMLVAGIAIGALLFGSGIVDPSAIAPEALMKIPGMMWITLLFAVLVVFLGVRMFQATAVAVHEPVGPIALIKRSWQLSRGVFWRLFALFLLLALAGQILTYVTTITIGSVVVLATGEPKPFNTSALLIALAIGLVGAIVSSISAAMAGRVYAQLSNARGADVTVPRT